MFTKTLKMDNMTLLRLENGSLDNVKNILNNFIAQVINIYSFVMKLYQLLFVRDWIQSLKQ